MKRLLCVLTLILLFASPGFSQAYSAFTATYAHRIAPLPALPATCDPANGELVFLTTAPVGLHSCVAANTWGSSGVTGMEFQLAQGTITASNPGLNLTATWNAGAVTFTEILANITDTASAAASLLIDLQVGAASQFSVRKDGLVAVPAAGLYTFATRSRIASSADSLITLSDTAGTDFDRLNLGTNTNDDPAIKASPVVGGVSQGIKIIHADGTDPVFADLGAAENGSILYCSDCTIASPCAGGGTGSIAKRLNGAWVCN